MNPSGCNYALTLLKRSDDFNAGVVERLARRFAFDRVGNDEQGASTRYYRIAINILPDSRCQHDSGTIIMRKHRWSLGCAAGQ